MRSHEVHVITHDILSLNSAISPIIRLCCLICELSFALGLTEWFCDVESLILNHVTTFTFSISIVESNQSIIFGP